MTKIRAGGLGGGGKKKERVHCQKISVSSSICHEGQLRVVSADRISEIPFEVMGHVFINSWREMQAGLEICRTHNEFNKRWKAKSPALWAALAASPVSLPAEHSIKNKTFLQQSIFIQADLVTFSLLNS